MSSIGCNFATLSFIKPNTHLCDGVISGYNVMYQLGDTGVYFTLNTTSNMVTLQDLAPNAEYTVQVAVITSVGSIGAYSSKTVLHITGAQLSPEIVQGSQTQSSFCVKGKG